MPGLTLSLCRAHHRGVHRHILRTSNTFKSERSIMNVILLEKIRNLGSLGEQVSVKPGFARNYLYPKRKAVPATGDNLKQFEEKRAELEKMGIELEKPAIPFPQALLDKWGK